VRKKYPTMRASANAQGAVAQLSTLSTAQQLPTLTEEIPRHARGDNILWLPAKEFDFFAFA